MEVFLAHTAGPWIRGVNDCFVAAADQLREWFGVDPMERYRGRYRTLTGYLRIIRQDGYRDAVEAFCGEMERHGFREAEGGPQERDVALIAYRDGGRPQIAPALFVEDWWHIRSKAGWLVLDGAGGIQKVYRHGH